MLVDTNSENIDEKLILKRIIFQQDKKALAVLYTKYYPQLKSYIFSRLDSLEDAEDLVQDLFLELYKGNGHYKGHGSVKGYLFGAAKKIIYQYHKQKTCAGKNIPPVSIDKVGQSYDNQQRLNPAKQIFAQELKAQIENTIAQLPRKEREAIRLRFISGLSAKESAEKAGCSVHTFCQRVLDAKKALREYKKMFEDKP